MIRLILALCVTSCATVDGGAIKNAMCEQFSYIFYSKYDTKGTVLQISKPNRVLEALCQKEVES